MANLLDRLVHAIAGRITRQLEPRLEAARAAAHGAVDDLDDRARLFRLELRAETSRLTRMAVYAVAGVVCAIGSLLWICAGVILLAWTTDYRNHAILAVVTVWVIATAFSIGMARTLAKRHQDAFRLSRALFAADAAIARQYLRERSG
jgi:uncharacterized membrane protein YqjE